MPHRRRIAVAVALLLPLAGCSGIGIDVPPGSVPVPVSIAPIPPASAGQPEYVCTAVYQVLTEGAVRLAEFTVNEDTEGLKKQFAAMAAEITAAGERSTDPAQREAVGEIAGALTEGARQPDPKGFLNGEFATIGQRLDGTCS